MIQQHIATLLDNSTLALGYTLYTRIFTTSILFNKHTSFHDLDVAKCRFLLKDEYRGLLMICTEFPLCAKALEYRIKISVHCVIKGYKMMYNVKCNA